jgi:hypothetical protein
MPSPRVNEPLSRRSILISTLGAGIAFGTGTALNRTAAQYTTPVATPLSLADHAIVGVWEIMLTLYPSNPPSVAIFRGDGVYIEYFGGPLGYEGGPFGWGIGAGFWRAFEADTGEFVANFQNLASAAETSPEKEFFKLNYVPEAHRFQPEVVSERVSFTLDPSGNTFTTRGQMEVRDGDGNIVAGPFATDETIGTRLVRATA